MYMSFSRYIFCWGPWVSISVSFLAHSFTHQAVDPSHHAWSNSSARCPSTYCCSGLHQKRYGTVLLAPVAGFPPGLLIRTAYWPCPNEAWTICCAVHWLEHPSPGMRVCLPLAEFCLFTLSHVDTCTLIIVKCIESVSKSFAEYPRNGSQNTWNALDYHSRNAKVSSSLGRLGISLDHGFQRWVIQFSVSSRFSKSHACLVPLNHPPLNLEIRITVLQFQLTPSRPVSVTNMTSQLSRARCNIKPLNSHQCRRLHPLGAVSFINWRNACSRISLEPVLDAEATHCSFQGCSGNVSWVTCWLRYFLNVFFVWLVFFGLVFFWFFFYLCILHDIM